MNSEEIRHIVQTGKLGGYSIGGGFLQVQWTTPQLEQGEFYLFKFTSANNELVSVNKIKTNYHYTRKQARKYVPMINSRIKSLLH